MNNDFTSNINKTLLWDLLKDTTVFMNVASVSKREYIIKIFEAQISEVASSTDSQTIPLTEMNKQFLNSMIMALQQQLVKPVPPESLSKETKADMQQQRASLFENRLKKKQDEFYKPTVPPPPKITFKDDDDSPIDVSAHLERMQMSRAEDMETVTFTTNDNWDFSSMKSQKSDTDVETRPQLKIDHSSDISDSTDSIDSVLNKKVSWSDNGENGNLNNFMDRLKQKKEEINSTLLGQIKSDLQEIKNIQYKILQNMSQPVSEKNTAITYDALNVDL